MRSTLFGFRSIAVLSAISLCGIFVIPRTDFDPNVNPNPHPNPTPDPNPNSDPGPGPNPNPDPNPGLRSVFDPHQMLVFVCCVSSGLLQILVCLLHPVSCSSILPYLAGCGLTMCYYHDSHLGSSPTHLIHFIYSASIQQSYLCRYTFIVGEFMFVESYIFFLASCLAPRIENPGGFSVVVWGFYLLAPTLLMLLVQDEFIHHTENLRQRWTVGESMLHFGELPFRWHHKDAISQRL